MSDLNDLKNLLKEYDEDVRIGAGKDISILKKIYKLGDVSVAQDVLNGLKINVADVAVDQLGNKKPKFVEESSSSTDGLLAHIKHPIKMVAIFNCLFSSVVNSSCSLEDFLKLLNDNLKIFKSDGFIDENATLYHKTRILESYIEKKKDSIKSAQDLKNITDYIKNNRIAIEDAKRLLSHLDLKKIPDSSDIIKDFFADYILTDLQQIGWYNADVPPSTITIGGIADKDALKNRKNSTASQACEDHLKDLKAIEFQLMNKDAILQSLETVEEDPQELLKKFAQQREEIKKKQFKHKMLYLIYILIHDKCNYDLDQHSKRYIYYNLKDSLEKYKAQIALIKAKLDDESSDINLEFFDVMLGRHQTLKQEEFPYLSDIDFSTKASRDDFLKKFKASSLGVSYGGGSKLDSIANKNNVASRLPIFKKDFIIDIQEFKQFCLHQTQNRTFRTGFFARFSGDTRTRFDFFKFIIGNDSSKSPSNNIAAIYINSGDFKIEYSRAILDGDTTEFGKMIAFIDINESDVNNMALLEKIIKDPNYTDIFIKYCRTPKYRQLALFTKFFRNNKDGIKDFETGYKEILRRAYIQALERRGEDFIGDEHIKTNLRLKISFKQISDEVEEDDVGPEALLYILEEVISSEKNIEAYSIDFTLSQGSDISKPLSKLIEKIEHPLESLNLKDREFPIQEIVINCVDFLCDGIDTLEDFKARLRETLIDFNKLKIKRLKLNIAFSPKIKFLEGVNFSNILAEIKKGLIVPGDEELKNGLRYAINFNENYQVNFEEVKSEQKRINELLKEESEANVAELPRMRHPTFLKDESLATLEKKGHKFLLGAKTKDDMDAENNENLEQEQEVYIDKQENQDKPDKVEENIGFDDVDLVSRGNIRQRINATGAEQFIVPENISSFEGDFETVWDKIFAVNESQYKTGFLSSVPEFNFRVDKMTKKAALILLNHYFEGRFVGALNLRHLPQGFYLARNAKAKNEFVLDFDVRRKSNDPDLIQDFASLQDYPVFVDSKSSRVMDQTRRNQEEFIKRIFPKSRDTSFECDDSDDYSYTDSGIYAYDDLSYSDSFAVLNDKFGSEFVLRLLGIFDVVQKNSKVFFDDFRKYILEPIFSDPRKVSYIADKKVKSLIEDFENFSRNEKKVFLSLISNMRKGNSKCNFNPILQIEHFKQFKEKLNRLYDVNIDDLELSKISFSCNDDLNAVCYRILEIMRYIDVNKINVEDRDYKKNIFKKMMNGQLSLSERGIYHALYCDGLLAFDENLSITDDPATTITEDSRTNLGMSKDLHSDKVYSYRVSETKLIEYIDNKIKSEAGVNLGIFEECQALYLRYIATPTNSRVNENKINYFEAINFIGHLRDLPDSPEDVSELQGLVKNRLRILKLFIEFKIRNYNKDKNVISVFDGFKPEHLERFCQIVSTLKELRPSFEDIANLAVLFKRQIVASPDEIEDNIVKFEEKLKILTVNSPDWRYISRGLHNLAFHSEGQNFTFIEIFDLFEQQSLLGDSKDDVQNFQRFFIASSLLKRESDDEGKATFKDIPWPGIAENLVNKNNSLLFPILANHTKLISLEQLKNLVYDDESTYGDALAYQELSKSYFDYFSIEQVKLDFSSNEYIKVIDDYYNRDNNNWSFDLATKKYSDVRSDKRIYLNFLNNFEACFRIDFIRQFARDQYVDVAQERFLREVEDVMRIFFKKYLGYNHDGKKENISVSSIRETVYKKSFEVFKKIVQSKFKDDASLIIAAINRDDFINQYKCNSDHKEKVIEYLGDFVEFCDSDFSWDLFKKYLDLRFAGLEFENEDSKEFLKNVIGNEFLDSSQKIQMLDLYAVTSCNSLSDYYTQFLQHSNELIGKINDLVTARNKILDYNVVARPVEDAEVDILLGENGGAFLIGDNGNGSILDRLTEGKLFYKYQLSKHISQNEEEFEGFRIEDIDAKSEHDANTILDSDRFNDKLVIQFVSNGVQYYVKMEHLRKYFDDCLLPHSQITRKFLRDNINIILKEVNKDKILYRYNGKYRLFDFIDLEDDETKRKQQISDLTKIDGGMIPDIDSSFLQDMVTQITQCYRSSIDRDAKEHSNFHFVANLETLKLSIINLKNNIENIYLQITEYAGRAEVDSEKKQKIIDYANSYKEKFYDLFAQILKFDSSVTAGVLSKVFSVLEKVAETGLDLDNIIINYDQFNPDSDIEIAFLRAQRIANLASNKKVDLENIKRSVEFLSKYIGVENPTLQDIIYNINSSDSSPELLHKQYRDLLSLQDRLLFEERQKIFTKLYNDSDENIDIKNKFIKLFNDLCYKSPNINFDILLQKILQYQQSDLEDDIKLINADLSDTPEELIKHTKLYQLYLELDRNPNQDRNYVQQFEDSRKDLANQKYLDELIGKDSHAVKNMHQYIDFVDSRKDLCANLSKEDLLHRIKQFADNILSKETKGENTINDRLELLALIRESYFRVNAKYPFVTQMIPLIYFVTSPCKSEDETLKSFSKMMAEISTGQGKSLISSIYSAFQAKIGKAVHVTSATDVLSKRDFKENQDFYRYLELDSHFIDSKGINKNPLNSETDVEYQKGRIYHSTPSSFYFYLSKERLAGVGAGFEGGKVGVSDTCWLSDETDTLLDNKTLWRLSVGGEGGEDMKLFYIFVNDFFDANQKEIDEIIKLLQANPDDEDLQDELQEGVVDKFKKQLKEKFSDIYDIFYNKFCLDNDELCNDKIKLFLSSARIAKSFKANEDFLVETTLIEGKAYNVARILKKPSNEPDRSSSWGDGVHQLLHARLERTTSQGRFRFEKENVAITSGTPKQLIQYCGDFVGITGTMGQQPDLELLASLFDVRGAFKVQPHQILQRRDLGTFFIRGQEQYQIEREYTKDDGIVGSYRHETNFNNKQIDRLGLILAGHDKLKSSNTEGVNRNRVNNQPMLIICDTLNDAKDLNDILSNTDGGVFATQIQIITGEESDEEMEAKIAKAGKKGIITISTPLSGRGTDIKIDQSVKEQGLYTILMSVFNDRETGQVEGRSGRNGNPGKTVSLINADDKRIAQGLKKIQTQVEDLTKEGQIVSDNRKTELLREVLFAKNRLNLRKQVVESEFIEEIFQKFCFLRQRLIKHYEENKNRDEDEEKIDIGDKFNKIFSNFLNDQVTIILKELKDFDLKKEEGWDDKTYVEKFVKALEEKRETLKDNLDNYYNEFLRKEIYPLVEIDCRLDAELEEKSEKFAAVQNEAVERAMNSLKETVLSKEATKDVNHERQRYRVDDEFYGITGLYLRARDPSIMAGPKPDSAADEKSEKPKPKILTLDTTSRETIIQKYNYDNLAIDGQYSSTQRYLTHLGIALSCGYNIAPQFGFERSGDKASKDRILSDDKGKFYNIKEPEFSLIKNNSREVLLFNVQDDSFDLKSFLPRLLPQQKPEFIIIPFKDGRVLYYKVEKSLNNISISDFSADKWDEFSTQVAAYTDDSDKTLTHEKLSLAQQQNLFITTLLSDLDNGLTNFDTGFADKYCQNYSSKLRHQQLRKDNLDYRAALSYILDNHLDASFTEAEAEEGSPVIADDTKPKYEDCKKFIKDVNAVLQRICSNVELKHEVEDCYSIRLKVPHGDKLKNHKFAESIAVLFGEDPREIRAGDKKDGELLGYDFLLTGSLNRENFSKKINKSISLLDKKHESDAEEILQQSLRTVVFSRYENSIDQHYNHNIGSELGRLNYPTPPYVADKDQRTKHFEYRRKKIAESIKEETKRHLAPEDFSHLESVTDSVDEVSKKRQEYIREINTRRDEELETNRDSISVIDINNFHTYLDRKIAEFNSLGLHIGRKEILEGIEGSPSINKKNIIAIDQRIQKYVEVAQIIADISKILEVFEIRELPQHIVRDFDTEYLKLLRAKLKSDETKLREFEKKYRSRMVGEDQYVYHSEESKIAAYDRKKGKFYFVSDPKTKFAQLLKKNEKIEAFDLDVPDFYDEGRKEIDKKNAKVNTANNDLVKKVKGTAQYNKAIFDQQARFVNKEIASLRAIVDKLDKIHKDYFESKSIIDKTFYDQNIKNYNESIKKIYQALYPGDKKEFQELKLIKDELNPETIKTIINENKYDLIVNDIFEKLGTLELLPFDSNKYSYQTDLIASFNEIQHGLQLLIQKEKKDFVKDKKNPNTGIEVSKKIEQLDFTVHRATIRTYLTDILIMLDEVSSVEYNSDKFSYLFTKPDSSEEHREIKGLFNKGDNINYEELAKDEADFTSCFASEELLNLSQFFKDNKSKSSNIINDPKIKALVKSVRDKIDQKQNVLKQNEQKVLDALDKMQKQIDALTSAIIYSHELRLCQNVFHDNGSLNLTQINRIQGDNLQDIRESLLDIKKLENKYPDAFKTSKNIKKVVDLKKVLDDKITELDTNEKNVNDSLEKYFVEIKGEDKVHVKKLNSSELYQINLYWQGLKAAVDKAETEGESVSVAEGHKFLGDTTNPSTKATVEKDGIRYGEVSIIKFINSLKDKDALSYARLLLLRDVRNPYKIRDNVDKIANYVSGQYREAFNREDEIRQSLDDFSKYLRDSIKLSENHVKIPNFESVGKIFKQYKADNRTLIEPLLTDGNTKLDPDTAIPDTNNDDLFKLLSNLKDYRHLYEVVKYEQRKSDDIEAKVASFNLEIENKIKQLTFYNYLNKFTEEISSKILVIPKFDKNSKQYYLLDQFLTELNDAIIDSQDLPDAKYIKENFGIDLASFEALSKYYKDNIKGRYSTKDDESGSKKILLSNHSEYTARITDLKGDIKLQFRFTESFNKENEIRGNLQLLTTEIDALPLKLNFKKIGAFETVRDQLKKSLDKIDIKVFLEFDGSLKVNFDVFPTKFKDLIVDIRDYKNLFEKIEGYDKRTIDDIEERIRKFKASIDNKITQLEFYRDLDDLTDKCIKKLDGKDFNSPNDRNTDDYKSLSDSVKSLEEFFKKFKQANKDGEFGFDETNFDQLDNIFKDLSKQTLLKGNSEIEELVTRLKLSIEPRNDASKTVEAEINKKIHELDLKLQEYLKNTDTYFPTYKVNLHCDIDKLNNLINLFDKKFDGYNSLQENLYLIDDSDFDKEFKELAKLYLDHPRLFKCSKVKLDEFKTKFEGYKTELETQRDEHIDNLERWIDKLIINLETIQGHVDFDGLIQELVDEFNAKKLDWNYNLVDEINDIYNNYDKIGIDEANIKNLAQGLKYQYLEQEPFITIFKDFCDGLDNFRNPSISPRSSSASKLTQKTISDFMGITSGPSDNCQFNGKTLTLRNIEDNSLVSNVINKINPDITKDKIEISFKQSWEDYGQLRLFFNDLKEKTWNSKVESINASEMVATKKFFRVLNQEIDLYKSSGKLR